MDNNGKGKPDPSGDPTGATSILERRRVAKVVHDERGNARVEWVSAPDDTERVPLSVEDREAPIRPEHGYDPYQKAPKARVGGELPERPAKRDLRKLSEWIKQMRELEARKQSGGDAED
ncbi:MAG: hypothetical protein ACREUT_21560 [Steroidobacteraceae bacterium]